MASTETKIPNLSIMKNIDRAELCAIVQSLGLDPVYTESITLTSSQIVVGEWEGPRIIGVVETFDA